MILMPSLMQFLFLRTETLQCPSSICAMWYVKMSIICHLFIQLTAILNQKERFKHKPLERVSRRLLDPLTKAAKLKRRKVLRLDAVRDRVMNKPAFTAWSAMVAFNMIKYKISSPLQLMNADETMIDLFVSFAFLQLILAALCVKSLRGRKDLLKSLLPTSRNTSLLCLSLPGLVFCSW